MIRRITSIILYVLAGWIMLGEQVMAFVSIPEMGERGKFLALAIILAFAGLFFLPGLLLARRGRRRREAGIVLLTTALIGAFEAVMIVYLIFAPDMREFMPPDMPDMKTMFGDWLPGIVNLAVMLGLGYWFMHVDPQLDDHYGDAPA